MSEYLRTHVRQQLFHKQPSTIHYKTQIGVCVLQTLKNRGYCKIQQGILCDIFWVQKQSLENIYNKYRITNGQYINHFRTYYELCRKDNLNRNLKKYKKILQKQKNQKQANLYNFYPLTYHLPIQYNVFIEEFKKNTSNKNLWIMKPVNKSQGKGIFIINKISMLSEWFQSNNNNENYIIQRYIDNPLLIGGKKFDLRIYVLCRTYKPLTFYIYRQGFARFTHQRYDDNNIENNEIHLTNVAIQKYTNQYNKNLGGKWQLYQLKLYMLSKFNSNTVHHCFYEIQQLIYKTMQSVTRVMSNEKNCFELYGFDILLDQYLKPWLIEVNGSPSMRANTTVDKQLKCNLIDDVMTILDIQQILRGNQSQIGGFDLICFNDVEKQSEYYQNRKISMLGTKNNRKKTYQNLAININNRINNNKSQLIKNEISSPKKLFTVRKNISNNSPIRKVKYNPQLSLINEIKVSEENKLLKDNNNNNKNLIGNRQSNTISMGLKVFVSK